MVSNRRGQALVESISVMLPLALIVFCLLFWAYLVMVNEWCGYWTYRTTICLAQEKTKWECVDELDQKISILVPRTYYEVNDVWKTPKKAQAKVHLRFKNHFYEFQKTIVSQTHLPLPSR